MPEQRLTADGLADAIELEMAAAWTEVKGGAMPASDPNDRRVMFLAIARGLIAFLQQNPHQVLSSIELSGGLAGDGSLDGRAYTVGAVRLNTP